MDNSLKHVVVVPDGNRRWAEKRGLPSFLGHRQGAKITEKIFRAALDLKIPYFTFWACSMDNITKRSKTEVSFLFKLFEQYFERLLKDEKVYRESVKINVFGHWEELLPERVKEPIRRVVEKTKSHQNYQLTFLMAYSGIDEMTEVVKKIAQLKSKNSELKIDQKLIKNNLWTKDLPPVDLVIRTGGEPHWSSGLMMWEVADSQLYFTQTLWPDFSEAEFKKAVSHYGQMERRLGE